MMLILYVDDMLLARLDIEEMVTLQSKLNETLDMKHLGDANHILGMHIMWDREKHLLYLSQIEYLDKVLERFNMMGGEDNEYPSSFIC